MKILFRNTTKYDKENIEKFNIFHKEKYGKRELIKKILIIIGAFYIFICNIIYRNWILLLVLIALCLMMCFLNKIENEREKKDRKKQKDKEFTFFFYERYLKMKYRRRFYRMSYFEIKKVFETKENFFIYVEEDGSLILDKEGFSVGDSKGFSEFIKRKCPFKYRNGENK